MKVISKCKQSSQTDERISLAEAFYNDRQAVHHEQHIIAMRHKQACTIRIQHGFNYGMSMAQKVAFVMYKRLTTSVRTFPNIDAELRPHTLS